MFNRIGSFFIGVMYLLDCISMLIHKNVKVGEKFFKFDDAGNLYLLPALAFLILSGVGFWLAFRKEPPVVQRLLGMWCPDCMKFYNIGEKCGQELLKCYNTHYETRPKPKTEPLFRSKPRNKKRKLKR